MPVVLGRPSPFVVDFCERLESAAGIQKPTLDRGQVQKTAGPKLAKLAFAIALRRNPGLRVPAVLPETAAALSALKRLLLAIDRAQTELRELERYSGVIAASDRRRLDGLRAAMDDFSHAFEFSRAFSVGRTGEVKLRHRRRRGQPRDEICATAAEALVPLWKQISKHTGVWRDATTGKWRGPLLDVAIWTIHALGESDIKLSHSTLAKELLRCLAA